MQIPLYQVDAFASGPFRGNPAAVCPLDDWLPDEMLQAIAEENNLSETAYYVRENGRYRLRWFTPTVEVDLCGHATLAAASIIGAPRVEFDSRSGELVVERDDTLYVLDFPARPPRECPEDPQLFEALGAKPGKLLTAVDYLCVFDTEGQVRALRPDMTKL
ncbi:MAG: PhzF family phenazine biosynthesis protein, partial [Bryobacteraceae bacterium]